LLDVMPMTISIPIPTPRRDHAKVNSIGPKPKPSADIRQLSEVHFTTSTFKSVLDMKNVAGRGFRLTIPGVRFRLLLISGAFGTF
jgi:hypothetical protein